MDCSRTPTRDLEAWLDLAPEFSQAIARQVRLYHWKQWKRLRTRRRNLIKLGANPDEVHMASRSRKGLPSHPLLRGSLSAGYGWLSYCVRLWRMSHN